ncbi:MAG: MaoC family dehydratase N-terminal domain-containing protein, partial [Chloroflexi bacterium]|nr:MaoC family dehydratase N-terminal domain-containing protein [Chloroflexota bacterium]
MAQKVQKVVDEQKKWDEEKWPARKESVYRESFFRKAQEGERDINDITQKDIEQMREWIGVRTPGRGRVFNQEVNRDNLRHLAQGDGNLNPLYFDEDYAKKTRWGGLIAPPSFIHCTGTTLPQEGQRHRPAGALRGLQGLYSGDDCYYYRPIRPGDFVWEMEYLYDVELKKSQFSGQTVFSRTLSVMANQKGELICVRKNLLITSGRQTKTDEKGHGERKKYAHIRKQYYTPEDIKRIDDDMDREEIRGANPRYWEDVNEG